MCSYLFNISYISLSYNNNLFTFFFRSYKKDISGKKDEISEKPEEEKIVWNDSNEKSREEEEASDSDETGVDVIKVGLRHNQLLPSRCPSLDNVSSFIALRGVSGVATPPHNKLFFLFVTFIQFVFILFVLTIY